MKSQYAQIQDIEAILNKNIIGLQLSETESYEEKMPEELQPGIQNFIIFHPYGLGGKVFIHGKDLFSEQNADKFYNSEIRDAADFNPAAVKKIADVFSPKTFTDRLGYYFLSQKPDQITLLKQYVNAWKELYPGIDFSSLPEPTSNFHIFINEIIALLGRHKIDLASLMQEAIANQSIFKKYNLNQIKEEVPVLVNSYLLQDSNDNNTILAKKRFGNELRSYMKQHQWDWEILENFKIAAISGIDIKNTTLEEFLQAGINIRAETTLLDLADKMHNPYDRRFIESEQEVACILVASVQTEVLTHCLRDKTAMLFTNSDNIAVFNDVFEQLPAISGKYHPNTPNSQYFSNFLFFSGPFLNTDRLKEIIRHECEHKLDLDSSLPFSLRFKKEIPNLMLADFIFINNIYESIENATDRPQLENSLKKLRKLADKRDDLPKNLNMSESEYIEYLQHVFLEDIDNIRSNMALFCTYSRRLIDEEHRTSLDIQYDSEFSQWLEIPAVMEQLKGIYGGDFIKALLPNLAEATDIHREICLEESQRKTINDNYTIAENARSSWVAKFAKSTNIR